jgi:kynurenine formamidase
LDGAIDAPTRIAASLCRCISTRSSKPGVYLIENLALAELAGDRPGSFCFVLPATKYQGATGCPVRSIALV